MPGRHRPFEAVVYDLIWEIILVTMKIRNNMWIMERGHIGCRREKIQDLLPTSEAV